MAETKKCEVCEAEIGESEKVCPKCSTDFDALEEAIKTIDTADTVRTKRRKAKEAEAAPPVVPPQPQPAKRSIFASLTRKG